VVETLLDFEERSGAVVILAMQLETDEALGLK
jgi:hypothetical protein